MTSRSATLVVMIIGVAVVTHTMGAKPMPRFVWNASESVPLGLYSVEPVGKLAVTNLVVAMPPDPLATFLAERGYLPFGVPLIKRILALPGQSVCRNELAIIVDGIETGTALAHDRRGRALPLWQGCRVIAQGEVFLMNWDEPASLDGRYFGPIPLHAIVGRAKPVWTNDHALSSQTPPQSLCSATARTILLPGQLPVRHRGRRRSRTCPRTAIRGPAATPVHGCAACPRRTQRPRHSRRLDASSTVIGVNIHGSRDSHSRMRTQR